MKLVIGVILRLIEGWGEETEDVGKVTVTIQSPQIQSQTLRNAVQQLLPTSDDFRIALLDLYGFKPAELEIIIESAEELAE